MQTARGDFKVGDFKVGDFRIGDLKVIIGLAGVLVIGILAIGIAYQVTFGVYHEAQQNALRSRNLVAAFVGVRVQLDQAREFAYAFFNSGNLENYEAYQRVMFEAKEAIQSMGESTTLSEAEKEMVALQLEAYGKLDALVGESVSTYIEFGLNNTSGLRGDVNSAAIELQEALASAFEKSDAKTRYTLSLLIGSALKMREYEKTYLETRNAELVDGLAIERENFLNLLDSDGLGKVQKKQFELLNNAYFEACLVIVEAQRGILESQKRIVEDFTTISDLSSAIVSKVTDAAEQDHVHAEERAGGLARIFYLVLAIVMLAIIASLGFLGKKLFKMIGNLQELLRTRAEDLKTQEQKNDALSESVVKLMEAADRLSHQDLTVTVPVSEDITGSVSDALNMMTRSTAATIWKITKLTKHLEQATITVNGQNNKVAKVAKQEQGVVASALETLEKSRLTMALMTSLANNCKGLADNASVSTQNALEAVQLAASSMLDIRGTVHESEKSIKRLGERSKEISGIVEIIKDIAERTHTLALNAGMQAVAAGEAGRGFSVVADEVQRLAEMARDSTGRITTLVKSIQAESAESMNIMNRAIGQVVEGSEKADNASVAMRSTGRVTEDLLEAVNRLAAQSKKQETHNEGLKTMAGQLRVSSKATEDQLVAQAKETESMLSNMQRLVQSVGVFTLPGDKKSA